MITKKTTHGILHSWSDDFVDDRISLRGAKLFDVGRLVEVHIVHTRFIPDGPCAFALCPATFWLASLDYADCGRTNYCSGTAGVQGVKGCRRWPNPE